jgi:fatty acid-binding protein DegV
MAELFMRRVDTSRCPIRIAALYTSDIGAAQNLLQQARQGLGVSDVAEAMLGIVSPVLGVHTGPGALGLAFMSGM